MLSLAYGMGMLLALTREQPRAAMLAARIAGRSCSKPERGVMAGGAARSACRGRHRRSPLSGAGAAVALKERGAAIALATDDARRALQRRRFQPTTSTSFRARPCAAEIRSLTRAPRRCSAMAPLKSWVMLGRLRPAVVVGFGGYPTVPPVMAATLRGIPTVMQDQNSVMGRANRLLAPRVTAIASSLSEVALLDPALKSKATCTGNPVRPNVVAAATTPYDPPRRRRAAAALVFGGSQGARVMCRYRAGRDRAARAGAAWPAFGRATGARRGSAAGARRLRPNAA